MTRRPWTAAELQVVRSCPPKEAARRLGCPVGRVWYRRRRLGVAPRRGRIRERVLRAKHALGWGDGQIARLFGCDRSAVRLHRLRLGLPANTRSPAVAAWKKRRAVAVARAEGFDTLRQRQLYREHRAAIAHGWPAGATRAAASALAAIEALGVCTRAALRGRLGVSKTMANRRLRAFLADGWVVETGGGFALAPAVAARRAAKREAAA